MNIDMTPEDQLRLAEVAGYDAKLFDDKAVGDKIIVCISARRVFNPYSPDTCVRLMHHVQHLDIHSWGMLLYEIQSASKHQPIPHTVAHSVLKLLEENQDAN